MPIEHDGVGAAARRFTKPYRWEIAADDDSGFVHAAGEADTQADARAALDAALPACHRADRGGVQGAVFRVVNPAAHSFEIVETSRGATFGRPALTPSEGARLADALYTCALELRGAAAGWRVAEDRENVRAGRIDYGPTRPPAAGAEELARAERRFYAKLEAVRGLMPDPGAPPSDLAARYRRRLDAALGAPPPAPSPGEATA